MILRFERGREGQERERNGKGQEEWEVLRGDLLQGIRGNRHLCCDKPHIRAYLGLPSGRR